MSKVGRNDLCPCGSGKKYKRCCLGKETSAVESILRLVTAEPAAAQNASAEPAVLPASAEPVLRPEIKLTLPKLKKLVSRELEWEHPAHEQLAMELIERMRDNYDRELIYEALVLWHGYSRYSKPAVKKSGSFCAAIEYILSEEYGFMQSQADLAAKYEVTTATVSRKVKEMQNYTEEYGLGGQADELAVLGSSELSPKQKSQQLLQMASGATAPKRRIQLARTALELYPDNPEAYVVLAEEAEEEQEARALLKEGMAAGERELGELFFAENKGHFWGLSETRPYIRVCKSYADACWFGGEMEEAAKTLEHILELNPDDNTGARYMLSAVYLYSNKLNAADKLLKQYKDDAAATLAYDRLILEFKKNGLTSQLKMLYRVARGVNKHVPDYLLGIKRLPSNLPDYIGMGDANEAVEYVITHSRLWTGLTDLLKWMMKQK